MKALSDILSENDFDLLKKEKFPGFIPPMLATLTDDYFDSSGWIYERKLDGVRCLISIKNGNVTLFSRNEKDISATWPELHEALEKQALSDVILDGEIVTFDGKVTSFSKLQNRIQLKDEESIKNSSIKVYLYLFDILYVDKYDTCGLPLTTRKKILKEALHWQEPIRYVTHRNESGKAYLEEACKKGWEGLIAKDAHANYVHSRSKKWLKFKCTKGQELIIGGFTEPEGSRAGFGAMLVGYYENDKLRYAGKVGTGFDDDFLKKWREKFDKIEVKTSPFTDFEDDNGGRNHWLKPKYIGEFGFTEWTKSNKLRHPRFIGMRDDKKPKKVVKENPK